MPLKRLWRRWNNDRGALKKCSAWMRLSSAHLFFFKLHTASMTIFKVTWWDEQVQSEWLETVSWYFLENSRSKSSTLDWLFGLDTLTKCLLKDSAISGCEVTPLTTECKFDWFLLYTCFHDFQKPVVSFVRKDECNRFQQVWFGFLCANLMARL